GSHILHNLLASEDIKHVTCIGRQNPHTEHEKLHVYITPRLMRDYPAYIKRNKPAPDILFCSISISSKEVGGRDNQRIIEFDGVVRIAKAAKEAGTKVFVLESISHYSIGRNSKFLAMKEDLERAIQDIGFEHVVIVRTPLVFGARDEGSTTSGMVLHALGNVQGLFTRPFTENVWQRRARQVARASINAGLDALREPNAPEISIVRSRDIPKVAKRWEHGSLRGIPYPPVTRVQKCSI
ncbi:hypothetical protein KEM56_003628, partial [Ascosphaera pollenicola]